MYIVGLAYDYCVGYTALDAKAFGFNVYVVDDCTRAVSQQSKVRSIFVFTFPFSST